MEKFRFLFFSSFEDQQAYWVFIGKKLDQDIIIGIRMNILYTYLELNSISTYLEEFVDCTFRQANRVVLIVAAKCVGSSEVRFLIEFCRICNFFSFFFCRNKFASSS